MLTGYVVGLLSSLRFVHCGAQIRLGHCGFPICRLSFLCFGLWIAAIFHCVFVAAEGPWFGLQLSCFGHVRAKKNSVLSCGLELCSYFGWDYPWLSLLLHRAVKGCFTAGMQWLSLGLCWLGRSVDGLVNPVVLGC